MLLSSTTGYRTASGAQMWQPLQRQEVPCYNPCIYNKLPMESSPRFLLQLTLKRIPSSRLSMSLSYEDLTAHFWVRYLWREMVFVTQIVLSSSSTNIYISGRQLSGKVCVVCCNQILNIECWRIRCARTTLAPHETNFS